MRNPEAVQVLVNHARDERAHGGARQPFSEGASAVVEDLGEMADTIQALPLRQAEHEVLQRQIAEASCKPPCASKAARWKARERPQ